MNAPHLHPLLHARGLEITDDLKTLADIVDFRSRKYAQHYPAVHHHGPDLFDLTGIVLFSRNQSGQIATTARIAFSGSGGLPSEALLRPAMTHRQTTGALCEIGKFIIDDEQTGPRLHDYFRAFYLIGCIRQLTYAFLVPQKHGHFYTRHIGARLAQHDTGETFGSSDNFSIFLWIPMESTRRFRKWIGIEE